MSWLSDIAGRAEQLLNQIDQNAALALKHTAKKTGAGRSGSATTLIDIEGIDEAQKSERAQSERAGISLKQQQHQYLRPDRAGSVSNRIHAKKEDNELIAYLNDPNEPTSSRCSSVASRFSASNRPNTFGTISEACKMEDDLKTQHSDTLKCLHMKESQIAVMCVRLQEAEEDNIKKDARIADLSKELDSIKKELGTRGGGTTSEQSISLKKLQHEREKEKKEFQKREREYVKRLELASSENSEMKKELQELSTKILKMEMNEQNLSEEIRLAKYNLEANKQEFDEYKQRAQKILSAKENLLMSLKENSSSGIEGKTNNVELEELRCERDLLKEDLQQSHILIYNLKGDIQEMENRLRDEQRASGAQRECLLEQVHQHLSQANQYREQMERTQLEYEFLQAEMRRQEEAVERKLAEKDNELIKLMEEKKSVRRYETSEVEQKVSLLGEKLIAKQTAIERLESEKRALELKLERAERAYRNAESAAIKAVSIDMRESNVGVSVSSTSLFGSTHSDSLLIRIVKLAANIIDHLG